MGAPTEHPLIVQKDLTILLEVELDPSGHVRERISRFADLVKSPDFMHTYRITPLSLWNAAAAGMNAEQVIACLRRYSKFSIPEQTASDIRKYMSRYGQLVLDRADDGFRLTATEASQIDELLANRRVKALIVARTDERSVRIHPLHRGLLKQELMRAGYPVIDRIGYRPGESLRVELRRQTLSGKPWNLRSYQQAAVDAFVQTDSMHDGSGVVVMPCGAGKTVIGLGVMSRLNCATLILTTNLTSVRQWKRELLDKTRLMEDQIGEYSGESKNVRPVTIATYQILTYRQNKSDELVHLKLFNERDWGLIIYDEVHLLPAPVFRATADIQAARRLGLTATLVREDGREEDVFSLIGPKRFELPWKRLENEGWIASVECAECRVPLDSELELKYRQADRRSRFRLAGENPAKLPLIRKLLARHPNAPSLIIGQYLNQLKIIASELNAPLITGDIPHEERERLYSRFKAGETKVLVVSKVANFAVDLPDAAVAIQVSGSFGSRQEEAQRIGRLLRPKQGDNNAYFYSIVSRDTVEQQYARKRQMFLLEQGYRYVVREEVQEVGLDP
jgi:DNA excision repair protein ERCC-3